MDAIAGPTLTFMTTTRYAMRTYTYADKQAGDASPYANGFTLP